MVTARAIPNISDAPNDTPGYRVSIVAFGRFRLDTARQLLLADGRPVRLRGRPIEILAFLVANAGRTVTYDEIIAHVWKGVLVGENNLPVQMSILRRGLKVHGADDLILTMPNQRAYRFVGDVMAPPAMPTAAEVGLGGQAGSPAMETREDTGRRWQWPALAITAVVFIAGVAGVGWHSVIPTRQPPRLSLAVLPFRNLSEDKRQDGLAEAISDDLNTDLAHIPGSAVTARASADSFQGRALPARDIGRALNVRYLLEGSLRAEDEAFHINAQLIDATTGAQLWSENFDTPLGHMAETRTAIVRRIASALDVELVTIEGTAARQSDGTDPDAMTLFYRARSITDHADSLVAFSEAQRLLEQAIKQQPADAHAMAQLGLTLIQKVRSIDYPGAAQDYDEARKVISRALDMAPQDATALAAEARLELSAGHCGSANYSAHAALAAEPNSIDALAVIATCALRAGKLDEASRAEEEVLRLNPEHRMNKPRYVMLSELRLLQRRYPDAIDFASQALAGDPEPVPGAPTMGRAEFCRLELIAAYASSGELDRAQALYAAYKSIWPHRSVWRVAAFATHGQTILEGYKRFEASLNQAGMPVFADEHAGLPVPPTDPPRAGGDFDPTPLVIPGAETIDTQQLVALLAAPKPPLILDIGSGAAVIRGAAWLDIGTSGEDDNHFLDRVIAERVGSGGDRPVVVMADGPFGYESYNGILHLLSRGAKHVLWYRGGEEAWASENLPATDQRPQ
jgi:TolB-like protein/DNA-binding winged helix-turn-helix (wHTH) protein